MHARARTLENILKTIENLIPKEFDQKDIPLKRSDFAMAMAAPAQAQVFL